MRIGTALLRGSQNAVAFVAKASRFGLTRRDLGDYGLGDYYLGGKDVLNTTEPFGGDAINEEPMVGEAVIQ